MVEGRGFAWSSTEHAQSRDVSGPRGTHSDILASKTASLPNPPLPLGYGVAGSRSIIITCERDEDTPIVIVVQVW